MPGFPFNSMPPKIFMTACEASGDARGAELMRELKAHFPSAEFCGLGGERMRAEGLSVLHDLTQISALGLGDVLKNYFTYRKIFYDTLDKIRGAKPDLIILIDSPAFNLRLAKKIKKRVPVVYYVSPQIWAWGGRRIHTIKKTVSKMITILPFEKEIYDRAGVPCAFVGHPLMDQISGSADRTALRKSFGMTDTELSIGILPGSREKEVRRILPVMLETAQILKTKFPQAVFYVTRSSNVSPALYETILAGYRDLSVRDSHPYSYDLLRSMDFAFVASGTATLETALLGVPFFLLYKASRSTYTVGRWLVRVPFLGLANLLAGRKIIPEFIQSDAKPARIAAEAEALLKNPERLNKMKADLAEIPGKLGPRGASRRAAETIASLLASQSISVPTTEASAKI